MFWPQKSIHEELHTDILEPDLEGKAFQDTKLKGKDEVGNERSKKLKNLTNSINFDMNKIQPGLKKGLLPPHKAKPLSGFTCSGGSSAGGSPPQSSGDPLNDKKTIIQNFS